MSPKELSYIDDALGHESFLKTQCQEAVNNLQDPELKTFVQALSDSLCMQDNIYRKMSAKGWYQTEQAETSNTHAKTEDPRVLRFHAVQPLAGPAYHVH